MGVLGLTGGPPGLVSTAWLMGALRITSTEITPEAAGVLPVIKATSTALPWVDSEGEGRVGLVLAEGQVWQQDCSSSSPRFPLLPAP